MLYNKDMSNDLNKDKVIDALKEVYDPEIPVNIVDLGLIYDVDINGTDVDVKMTLTAAGCGMGLILHSKQNGPYLNLKMLKM